MNNSIEQIRHWLERKRLKPKREQSSSSAGEGRRCLSSSLSFLRADKISRLFFYCLIVSNGLITTALHARIMAASGDRGGEEGGDVANCTAVQSFYVFMCALLFSWLFQSSISSYAPNLPSYLPAVVLWFYGSRCYSWSSLSIPSASLSFCSINNSAISSSFQQWPLKFSL